MTEKNKFDFGILSSDVQDAVAYVRKIGKSNRDPETRQKADDLIMAEFGRRLRVVQQRYCDHLCEENGYITLLFRLACDLIPNFDFENERRGRPRKGSKTGADIIQELPKVGTPKLVLLIRSIMEEKKFSVKKACEHIRRQKGEYYAEYRNTKIKVIETRYHELKHLYDPREQKVRCPGCECLVGLEYFPQSNTAK